jgi:DNA repair protein RadA/Sms
VALAVASAARGVPLGGAEAKTPLACFGEVGLTGELRFVAHAERRAAEAAKFGLGAVVAPRGSGGDALEAGTLREALATALPGAARPRAA